MTFARPTARSPRLRAFSVLAVGGAGLLAAYLGWGFGDEHARARYAVMEGIAAAKPAKLAIDEHWRAHRDWPDLEAQAASLLAAVKPDRYVEKIAPAANGHLLIVYKAGPDRAHPEIDGRSIELTPRLEGADIRWDCRGGDMPDDFRPSVCRR